LPTDESESTLVARAIRGDADAFGILYALYFDRVYLYARLKMGNPTDAEDLTATVFLKAWKSIDRFSPKAGSSFAGWLFRLAHNTLVDGFRRAKEVISLDSDGAAHVHNRASASPEDQLVWRMTLDELHQALGALTQEQRDVVLLRFVEGLSAREVGTIMGKQEGAVRGMQFRAIEALRRALSALREEPLHND
jgi:RNA polymerase sigma-70 factor (ECF subfamily)